MDSSTEIAADSIYGQITDIIASTADLYRRLLRKGLHFRNSHDISYVSDWSRVIQSLRYIVTCKRRRVQYNYLYFAYYHLYFTVSTRTLSRRNVHMSLKYQQQLNQIHHKPRMFAFVVYNAAVGRLILTRWLIYRPPRQVMPVVAV